MTLATVPTTNLRIVVSVSLAVLYVLGVLTLLACGVTLPVEIVGGLGAFLLAMMGLDVAQFTVKRRTFQAPPPPSGS
ncbi:MAG TPA: hypothetical protein VFW98_08295 [Gemmatimonadaceae bacterium]|nr:hypothetical protein [Gemmatimonadaceae bacterium]